MCPLLSPCLGRSLNGFQSTAHPSRSIGTASRDEPPTSRGQRVVPDYPSTRWEVCPPSPLPKGEVPSLSCDSEYEDYHWSFSRPSGSRGSPTLDRRRDFHRAITVYRSRATGSFLDQKVLIIPSACSVPRLETRSSYLFLVSPSRWRTSEVFRDPTQRVRTLGGRS